MPDPQDAVAQAAGALRESAKAHKRASQFHRRAAQRDMEALARLEGLFGVKLKRGGTNGGSHGDGGSAQAGDGAVQA